MSYSELAFKTGRIFNKKITSSFWSSFKGEYGRVQIEVLVYLSEVSCIQPSEIVNDLNISKQHVSRIIKEFISDGYVASKPNPEDKRANLVYITESGKEYLKKHIEISNNVFDDILSKMNEKDQKEFLEAMEIIYTLLDKN